MDGDGSHAVISYTPARGRFQQQQAEAPQKRPPTPAGNAPTDLGADANPTLFAAAVGSPRAPVGPLGGEVRMFVNTGIQIFISLFISPFYKMYIHPIGVDKIHFVARTKHEGISC